MISCNRRIVVFLDIILNRFSFTHFSPHERHTNDYNYQLVSHNLTLVIYYSQFIGCYPHMPIGNVWICWLLFVCLYGYEFLRRG